MTCTRSKRLRIGAGNDRLCFSFFERSYRPPTGLAAAKMDVRALSVAWIPALDIEMVCCSIASWIATWSLASILSNSSMQQMPLSANIKAPASMQNSPVSTSFATVAVKPAADDDFDVPPRAGGTC